MGQVQVRVLGRVSLKPEPTSGFILKTQTQPFCFMDWVKPNPLGLGRVTIVMPMKNTVLSYEPNKKFSVLGFW